MREKLQRHWLIYALLTVGGLASLALGFVIEGTAGLMWAGAAVGLLVGGMIASLTRDDE